MGAGGVLGLESAELFGDGEIFQGVGGRRVEDGFVGGGGDPFIGAERFAGEGFEFLEAGEFVEIA